MAVPFASNVELLSTLPNFTRDMFKTKTEMMNFAEYKLPEIFITTCVEDGNVYVYNKNNSVDPTTGKWRAINASGSTSYDDLVNKPSISGKDLNKESTYESLSLYDRIDTDSLLGGKVDKVEGKQLSTEDFTTEEKAKLNTVEENANANVQADWNETDEEMDSFIKNKPVLFSGDYNDLSNKPVNLSEFNNDSKFITNLVDNLENYYTKTQTYTQDEINAKLGAIATLSMIIVDELPDEGSSKIIYLIKKTGTAGYIEWIYTLGEWVTIGDTDVDLSDYVKKTELADVATTGSYKDLNEKPTIPENTSDLVNDSNFVAIDDENISKDTPYSSKKVEERIAALAGSSLEQDIESSVTVGGINEGDKFTVGTTLTQLFVKLLEKYVAPGISISISPSTTLYEKGNTVSSIVVTATVTKKSEEIEKVSFLVNGVEKEVITEDVKAGGSFTYTYDTEFGSNTTFKVVTNDVDTKTSKSAETTVSFILPYYYGVVDSDTITSLSGLTKDLKTKGSKTYSYTANDQYCVIVYDSSYADLTSIKDQNNFENIGNFTKKTVKVGDYTYKYYITTGKKTLSGFKFTFA